jgi:hypothetical protein
MQSSSPGSTSDTSQSISLYSTTIDRGLQRLPFASRRLRALRRSARREESFPGQQVRHVCRAKPPSDHVHDPLTLTALPWPCDDSRDDRPPKSHPASPPPSHVHQADQIEHPPLPRPAPLEPGRAPTLRLAPRNANRRAHAEPRRRSGCVCSLCHVRHLLVGRTHRRSAGHARL